MSPRARIERKIIHYVNERSLYLETADYRLFVQPYGPLYPDAVGRVYKLVPSGPVPHDKAETLVAHVRSITPRNIFDKEIGEDVPIRVFAQVEHEDGLVLLAKIQYGPQEPLADFKKRNGKWLVLVLYLESATMSHVVKEEN